MQLLILFVLNRKCIHTISRFIERNTLNLLRNALYNSFFFKFHQLKCLLFQATGKLTLTLRYKPRTAATQFPVLAELSLNPTLFPSVTPKNSLRKNPRPVRARAKSELTRWDQIGKHFSAHINRQPTPATGGPRFTALAKAKN